MPYYRNMHILYNKKTLCVNQKSAVFYQEISMINNIVYTLFMPLWQCLTAYVLGQ
jgi:uncharacterized membrane protein YccF (DUF307 family)